MDAHARRWDAALVVGATRLGEAPLALTKDAPPFRLARGAWTVVPVAPHAKPIVGAGARPLAALGRAVMALDGGAKLPEAPAPILALAASPRTAVIATERGLLRLEHNAWKPVANAPPHVVALVSERFALVATPSPGLFDLDAHKSIAWPAGVRVAVVAAIADDTVMAVAEHAGALELLTARAGKPLASEPIPLDAPVGPVALVGDRAGRIVIALRDGRLAVRVGAAWSEARVRDELPPPHPGPPPAIQP